MGYFYQLKTLWVPKFREMKKAVGFTLCVSILLLTVAAHAQYYPHHDSINYQENFRGQYHFSPRSEWMNDINGLVDWGQLEVFSNDGLYSYSEQFAFNPSRDELEIYSDADIQLVSMEFHEIASIW